MQYLYMALMGIGIVGLDQFTKWLVLQNIPLGGFSEAIDGLFHFTYVQNTGAAFSSLEGQHWLFILVTVAMAVFIIWEFPKKKMDFTMFERWMIAGVFAGGVGNLIDRLAYGYVVDMIQVDFMNFAVFNVADCFITCCCIALIVHLAFFNKEFWKDDKK